jgi:hypothetical protein
MFIHIKGIVLLCEIVASDNSPRFRVLVLSVSKKNGDHEFCECVPSARVLTRPLLQLPSPYHYSSTLPVLRRGAV